MHVTVNPVLLMDHVAVRSEQVHLPVELMPMRVERVHVVDVLGDHTANLFALELVGAAEQGRDPASVPKCKSPYW